MQSLAWCTASAAPGVFASQHSNRNPRSERTMSRRQARSVSITELKVGLGRMAWEVSFGSGT
jgi:hypothetical protein